LAVPSDSTDPGPELPPELARLPAGRHGLPREFVVRNQRERLIAGLAEAVAEKGFAGTTVTDITKAASVSRRTFYEHFESREECFLAAYDVVLEQIRASIVGAAEVEQDWPLRVRAGLAALLGFLASEPNFARLGLVESLVAGPEVIRRHRDAIDSFIPLLRLGREGLLDEGDSLPETTEEALVGGISLLIARRVIAGQAEGLEELLPDLVQFTLTPYLGPEQAERLAELPAPTASSTAASTPD
jgi:AcrR family transcriptional regulator